MTAPTPLQRCILAETEYMNAKAKYQADLSEANYQAFMVAEAAYEDVKRSVYPQRTRTKSFMWRSSRR